MRIPHLLDRRLIIHLTVRLHHTTRYLFHVGDVQPSETGFGNVLYRTVSTVGSLTYSMKVYSVGIFSSYIFCQ